MSQHPVLVIGFNRPDLLHQTFRAVSKYRPTKLYFACDGPRLTHPRDGELVAAARKSVEAFPWQCSVEKRFQPQNLGLRKNMIAAIDWFFNCEPEGIVLEDDCVPTLDFFYLMEHILDKYRDEPKVWGATGSNPSKAPVSGNASYGFIRSALVWGWASWADRWAQYDRDLTEYRKSGLAGAKRRWKDPYEYHALDWHLRRILRQQFADTWDYQLSWTVTHHDGLWAVPAQNLVSNVGFRSDATHTNSAGSLDQTVRELGKIQSPRLIERDNALQRHIHCRQHRVLQPLWLNYFRNIYRLIPLKARKFIQAGDRGIK